MECLKIGLNHTLNFVRIKSVVHKLCSPFSSELNLKLKNKTFFVSDERLHIEYMCYLKRLCMFPVRLVDICILL